MEGFCSLGPQSQFLFILTYCFLGISLISFEFLNKRWLPIIFLIITGITAGYLYATLDPFFNMWDEQFHVLVAKNMIDNPFKPMLYRDFIHSFKFDSWVGNEIWLHKQPLFMWQMALSMSIFGVNEIAARLPDILMHVLMIILIYRIGEISINRRTGFYAAVLYTLAHFPLELISGSYIADHNDKAFIFYVTASIWALFEYRNSSKPGFYYLVGILAGMAVLVKWLAGLLVFGPWFLTLFFFPEGNRYTIKNYLPLIKAFAIALIVFIPWQIYIFNAFPNEAAFELDYTSRHFTEAIEGHYGDICFHIDSMRNIILDSDYTLYLVILGLIAFFFRSSKKEYILITLSSVFAVYIFYTMACTKMAGFTSIVTPLIFIGFAAILEFLYSLCKRINIKYIVSGLWVIILFFTAFIFNDLNTTAKVHTEPDNLTYNYRNAKLREAFIFKKLNNYLNDENYVIYNTGFNLYSSISGMIYTPYICHSCIPTDKQISESISKGYKVAVFNIDTLPDYIMNNPKVKVINIPYKQTFRN